MIVGVVPSWVAVKVVGYVIVAKMGHCSSMMWILQRQKDLAVGTQHIVN
jgi:hypothetical protein